MALKLFSIVYCVVQVVVFFFVLVGTPIDQFRYKNQQNFNTKGCLTFWGWKNNCYGTAYESRVEDLFRQCSPRKSRFQAAEAFSIISIFVLLASVIFGLIQFFCCRCFRWICLILSIAGVITTLICWACMASEYSTYRGTPLNCSKLRVSMRYGAGFALYVTAWCLCLVNIASLLVPW